MQLTPEIKAQLAEQKKLCIFCKIISKEQESKIVFEDDKTMAVLDIFPALKGHTTFFLKEHYPIMPYIPADEFKHYFGLLPQLSGAVKKAFLTTGSNVFIANGGPAGQRSPHFLLHIFPREEDDGFFNFLWKSKATLEQEKINMLANNLSIMMRNHFGRNPAEWHVGKGDIPSFLTPIYESSSVIYEDEKVLCTIPQKGVAAGHIEVYSKEEEKYLEKVSQESAEHLFFAASFAATAVFEGLGAHATNIIVKSGESDDNPPGKLCVHIIPRMQDDVLQKMLWEPKQPKYDLDGIKKKIKDKTWNVKYKKAAATPTPAPKSTTPPILKFSDKPSSTPNSGDEITDAISRFHR